MAKKLKWMRLGCLAPGILGAAWLLLLGFISEMVVRPPEYEHRRPEQGLKPLVFDSIMGHGRQGIVHDPKTDLKLDYEAVEFPSTNGSRLRGWYIPAEREATTAIVAVHGAGADRREFLRHTPLFHDAGYPVLLFDCREHGISDGASRGISLGIREQEDVIAAVRYLKQARKFKKVAAIGTSQGGASVILAAAREPAIDAVISENPFTRPDELLQSLAEQHMPELPNWILSPAMLLTLWRMDALDQPGAIDVIERIAPRPILLMHGLADVMVPAEHSRRLFDRAGEPKFLWMAPGARHALLFNRYPDEYRRRVLEFLGRFIPPQPPSPA